MRLRVLERAHVVGNVSVVCRRRGREKRKSRLPKTGIRALSLTIVRGDSLLD